MGAEVVFWATKVDKYLNRSGSLEAMVRTVLNESVLGEVMGEHLL